MAAFSGSRRAKRVAGVIAAIATALAPVPAGAWDAEGHRIVTVLALEALPPSAPAFLRDARTRDAVAFLSNECDRWRGVTTPPMGHENKPDHYIDLDLLPEFGLTAATLPPFRYDYLAAMAIAKKERPDRVSPYDAARDRDKSQEWPGFLPHAIVEHYAKLTGSFRTLRILEAAGAAATPAEIETARWNAIVHMGHLSHFVGDAAQPLHTTKHFNGWVGPNPNGYTVDKKFHALIDGGVIARHKIGADLVRGRVVAGRTVEPEAPFPAVMEHIGRAFAEVEPLYALERAGDLEREKGRDFVVSRLADGAGFLAALYDAAWTASAPTAENVRDFLRYDGRNGSDAPKAPAAESPAGSTNDKENE